MTAPTLTMKEFVRFKGFMARTTSDNDPEALTSIRMANRLLAEKGITWEQVFARVVTVIDSVEEDPDNRGAGPAHDVDVPADHVAISGYLVRESDSGLAYLWNDGDTKQWVPKSKCTLSGDRKTMVMPEWLAREKGFI